MVWFVNVRSTIPTTCKNRIHAHDSGCSSILFQNNSSQLVNGGQDHSIKLWDTSTGTLSHTLHGCLGLVLDLTIISDNKTIIAANSLNNLNVWDVSSGQIQHTVTRHSDKVCAVDVSKVSNCYVVSAGCDRTIKSWDLQRDIALIRHFTRAIALPFVLSWMEEQYAWVISMAISGFGIFRQVSFLLKLLLILLLSLQFPCLELEARY